MFFFPKSYRKLENDKDYVVDEKQKTANLTEEGILKIEKF
jgi:preprotein translocase subunit SecA